jgi:hypothetical protein
VRLVGVKLRAQLVLPQMIPNGQGVVPLKRMPVLLDVFARSCLPAPKRLVADTKLFFDLTVWYAAIGLRARTVGF